MRGKTMGSDKAPLSEPEKQMLYHLMVTRLPSHAIADRMGVSVNHVYHLWAYLKRRRGQTDLTALEAEWRAAGLLPGDQL